MSFSEIDEQVVRRNELIRDLSDRFVRVRLVRAETLDLSLFQFDPDLSFAVFFLNADKTIYGRYSSRRDFHPADSEVSLEGLRKAMEKALQWHEDLTRVEATLQAKRGPKPMYATLADFPSSRPSRGYSRSLGGGGSGCKHCHDLRTAEQLAYRASDQRMPDNVLFAWPMPDAAGLHLDPHEMATVQQVLPESAAERAGFQVGDRIERFEGQPILSIADVQWVLQNAGDQDRLLVDFRRGDDVMSLTLELADGWRRAVDVSWRITTSELRRRIIHGVSYRNLTDQQRQELGIASDEVALLAARGVSRSTGLVRRGDVIVAVDGNDDFLSEGGLIAHFLQEKEPGDNVKLTLLRNGAKIDVDVPVTQ